ncbi:dihydroxyacetone kinase subunit L [Hydrogenoanaerobacterium sp.]|uniref:dihydroxyacetone kinase subunit L n=1 Tax=Hydrogenoanaerobacterium sp. TaxID=2953763 RepID=UPI0028997516|nr:dihydroxyacetone kinase subunit L [Hydrogenoanaerobacterium sp.]
MNATTLKEAFAVISDIMLKNKDYLIELDQQNGDGDLGISMSGGYKAVADYLADAEEKDLGKLLLKSSTVFNEAAPSSLGTITSFGLMGMAKALKGKEETTLAETAEALCAGVEKIMDKAKSKPGEKTILDALCPAVETLKANSAADAKTAFQAAYDAAAAGSESTKAMKSVHGRAAYYGEKSIGLLDGGSVVGKLIFEGLYQCCCR